MLIALLACGAEPEAPQAAPPPPDVVLILIDTLRADEVEGFGAQAGATPFLGKLGGEGVRFETAWSTSSWTAPSTASMFTSRYPTEIGVLSGMVAMKNRGEPYSLNKIPDDIPTLPQLLSQGGYQTVGFATNLNIDAPLGFAAGFDHFEQLPDVSVEDVATALAAVPRTDQPRFTYLHLNDVHAPYDPRADWLESDDPRGLYRSEIGYLDHHLGRLYDAQGWDEALVGVVSDHGEEFGEHGAIGHSTLSLHREVNQIPMIWHGPGIPSGEVQGNVSLIDVLPTLLELTELPPIDRSGRSLVASFTSGSVGERTLYAHRQRHHPDDGLRDVWAVTTPADRLIREDVGGALFDLTDRFEQTDLAPEKPERVDELGAVLQDFEDANPATHRQTFTTTQTDAEAEALRRLGYIE